MFFSDLQTSPFETRILDVQQNCLHHFRNRQSLSATEDALTGERCRAMGRGGWWKELFLALGLLLARNSELCDASMGYHTIRGKAIRFPLHQSLVFLD